MSNKKTTAILYISFLWPQKLDEAILMQPLPPAQTKRFGEALLSAITKNFDGNITVLSFAPLLDFPRCKHLISPIAKWHIEDKIKAYLLPFINISGLKHFTKFIFAFLFCLIWAFHQGNKKGLLLLHGVQSCNIWAALLVGKLFSFNVVPFLTDDLGIPLKWEGKFIRLMRILDVFLIKMAMRRVNGVASMTLPLANKWAPQKPKIIINAIYNEKMEKYNYNPQIDEEDIFYVGYFGGLYEEYGVILLLEAFAKIKKDNWHLIIGGRGPLENKVKEIAKNYKNINYLGFLSDIDLKNIYNKINVFVNPRLTTSQICLYSFPSKLVEYMGTGKPVVSTNLPTLDDKFKEHLILMKEDTADELINCLDYVSRWKKDQYNLWRIKTINFIKEELSPKTQGRKIIEFIESLK